jgi:hypothetical protein
MHMLKFKKVNGAATPEPAPKPLDPISALIDEIGAMLPAATARHKRIKELQAEQQPYTEKMKALTALLSALPGAAPDQPLSYEGKHFVASAGKRCMVRRVANPQLAIQLLNKVRKGVAWEVVYIPLGKLDAFLNPEQRAQVIDVEYGDRTVTITERL